MRERTFLLRLFVYLLLPCTVCVVSFLSFVFFFVFVCVCVCLCVCVFSLVRTFSGVEQLPVLKCECRCVCAVLCSSHACNSV